MDRHVGDFKTCKVLFKAVKVSKGQVEKDESSIFILGCNDGTYSAS